MGLGAHTHDFCPLTKMSNVRQKCFFFLSLKERRKRRKRQKMSKIKLASAKIMPSFLKEKKAYKMARELHHPKSNSADTAHEHSGYPEQGGQSHGGFT
jgi:hypothetical protein